MFSCGNKVFGVVSMRFGVIFGRFGVVWGVLGGLGCFHGPSEIRHSYNHQIT